MYGFIISFSLFPIFKKLVVSSLLPDFRRRENNNTSELSVVGAVSEGVPGFLKSLTINTDIHLLFQKLGKLEKGSFSHQSIMVWAFLFK